MLHYKVYIQNAPTRNKRTQDWEASLELLGQVEAKDSNHAFFLARRYCNHPIIEKLPNFLKVKNAS